MRLHFAFNGDSQGERLLNYGAKNILMSYAYSNGKLFERILPKLDKTNALLVDSGAFTAWTKGKQVDLEAYIKFCKEVMGKTKAETWIVNLDVIPGSFGQAPTAQQREESAQKGWDNYERMKAAGLPVIHVFHMYEDFKWLKRLAGSSGYIGISPANDSAVPTRLAWLKNVFAEIKNKVKTHCFGLTSYNVMSQVPFFSADSSVWNIGLRYGLSTRYSNFKSQNLSKKDMDRVNNLGIDCDTFYNKPWERVRMSVESQLQMEKDLTRLWAARGIKW